MENELNYGLTHFMKDRRHLMHPYPHKIESGEGEVITFLGVVRDQDGDRMEVELLAPPNSSTGHPLRCDRLPAAHCPPVGIV